MRTPVGDQGLSGLISGAVRVRAGDRVRAGTRGRIRTGIAVRGGGRRAGTGVGVTVLRRIQINGMEIRIGYGLRSRFHLGIRGRRGIESRGVICVSAGGIGRGVGGHGHFGGCRRLRRSGERCQLIGRLGSDRVTTELVLQCNLISYLESLTQSQDDLRRLVLQTERRRFVRLNGKFNCSRNNIQWERKKGFLSILQYRYLPSSARKTRDKSACGSSDPSWCTRSEWDRRRPGRRNGYCESRVRKLAPVALVVRKIHFYVFYEREREGKREKKEPYVGQRVEKTNATIRDCQRNVRGDSGFSKGLLQLLYRLFRRLSAA